MTSIRPLMTEDDYARAIAEIANYFDNPPEIGSPEGDRFDILAALIETYEARHHPINPSDRA